jgi:hypothetical protein
MSNPGGMPGLGGKGPSGAPGGLNQLPVDMNGQVLGTGPGMFSPGSMGQQVANQQANIPQPPAAPPAAVQQGGTPGRPVPSAPMSPRGPGYANPGGLGAPQQQRGILTNPQGQNMPMGGMQNRLAPAPPAPAVRPVIPQPGQGGGDLRSKMGLGQGQINPYAAAGQMGSYRDRMLNQGGTRGAGRGGLLK